MNKTIKVIYLATLSLVLLGGVSSFTAASVMMGGESLLLLLISVAMMAICSTFFIYTGKQLMSLIFFKGEHLEILTKTGVTVLSDSLEVMMNGSAVKSLYKGVISYINTSDIKLITIVYEYHSVELTWVEFKKRMEKNDAS